MVSVVMPVYNAMPYLVKCLDSIIAQSYENWELIAIDDYSTDDSLEILRKYQQSDSRINVFSNHKKGIIPALQLAYQHSNGDLITRMDADDIMPPLKLELMRSAVESNIDSCAVGYVHYFSDQMLHDGYIRYQNWLNSLVDNHNHYKEIYKECVIPSPCWMMKKETFEHIGGFSSKYYPEDYDLAFRMYQHNIHVVPIPKILHLWRDHGERASRNDDNYKDQRFYNLKLRYFLHLDYDEQKPLILWGAGKSGKTVAKLLSNNTIDFRWITNNNKKIGKDIYDIKIEDESILKSIKNHQILSAIKEPNYLEKVRDLHQSAEQNGCSFFFFH